MLHRTDSSCFLLFLDMCFLHYGQLKYVPFSSILFSPVVRPLQEFENPCIEPSR